MGAPGLDLGGPLRPASLRPVTESLQHHRLTLIKVVAILIFFIVAIVIDTGGIG